MTFKEFQVFITPLAMHFSAVKDEPTWRLYHAALMVSPAPTQKLLTLALPRAASSRRFFPSVEELRADAEAERKQILAAHPYRRCAECRDNSGWTPVITDGVERMERCDCFERYRASLAQLGVGDGCLLLSAARLADEEPF